MERLDGGSAVPQHLRGAIVALGNFDGFHRGHQAVVGRAVSRGRAEGKPVLVATFDPHPVHFFKPDLPPFRLTSLAQRERLFAAAGADAMLVFRFDATLAAVSAQEFVADHVASRIGATGVVTGEDFTFGKSRGGDVDTLKLLGQAHRISVDAVAAVADDDGAVSSSRVREALLAGEPEEAARLLTRPFAIEGVVEPGDKNGRRLGYPTANIGLGDYLRPRFGVYAVRARRADGSALAGVANLGVRPMYQPPRELLEPHFFDFDGDLYGERLEVELLSFIRAEAVYDGEAALIAQIGRDADEARRRLAR
jgi:riboflavin kinase/FMN adenylyltransferase